MRPSYQFEAAKVIVSLDSDFLGSEQDLPKNIRGFAAGRRIENPRDSLNRLYVVESLYTITGFNADHRLRVPSSSVAQIGAALAAAIDLYSQYAGGADGTDSSGAASTSYWEYALKVDRDLIKDQLTLKTVFGYSPNVSGTGAWGTYSEAGFEIVLPSGVTLRVDADREANHIARVINRWLRVSAFP